MERNTLLAIVLSAVVLFGYQAIFVAPKQVEQAKSAALVPTQTSIATSNSAISLSPNVSQETTNAVLKTSDYNIKTTETNFLYSNMGGSLHQVDFIGNNPFPITDVLTISGLENVPYTGQIVDKETVSLDYPGKDWEVRKIYKIEDNHLIKVRMEIKNVTNSSVPNNFLIKAFEIDQSRMEITQNNREIALYEYSVLSNNKIFRKGNANKFNDKSYKNESAVVGWVGFRDHYHAFVVKPKFETKGYEIQADSDKQLGISIKPQDKTLGPGESIIYDFDIYVGPQNPWLMKKYGDGFDRIVAFSNFPIIEWIGEAIYYTIPFLHRIFRSWGVAIILVSMIIYGITYPLTMQSMMSMRKMQEVQPKIKALQERFKSDPQKLNTEMMEIYRREKINPLGGCLPFLIQMPFFMALYQILWRAQYFQGQGFLWIRDLSQPDRLMTLPFYLPFFGNEFNILPILTGCIMFVQQRISSKNMVVTDEQQLMQQKMMMYVLPVMMTCMFYKFASSWAIYFLVFYILSTATQWKIAQLSVKK